MSQRLVLALVFVLAGAFSLRAQVLTTHVNIEESAFDIRVFFPFDNATLRADYMDNGETLAMLDSALSVFGTEKLDSVVIIGSSSPEGRYSYNLALSQRRSESMRKYLVENYPELEDKLVLSDGNVALSDMRQDVAADDRLTDSEKDKIIAIIDGSDRIDVKAKKLNLIPAYKRYYGQYFRKMRYAAFRLVFPIEIIEVIEEHGLDVPPLIIPDFDESEIEEVPFPPIVIDSVEVADDIALKTVRYTWPLLAVSTNLLGELAMVTGPIHFTPNIAVELPLGQKWSILAEYTFPWWLSRDNSQAWQILKWDIGARWWFSSHNPCRPMDCLRGHFLGIDLSAGYYDIEPSHRGWQGEFQLAGLEYGYSWAFGDHWRLEANIGAGIMLSHYRQYHADAADEHLVFTNSGRLTWLGPTKAGISIKYLFSRKPKVKEGKR